MSNRARREAARQVGKMAPAIFGCAALVSGISGVAGPAGVSYAAPVPSFVRVNSAGVGTFPTFGAVRTSDGVLHLLYQATSGRAKTPTGLITRTISPSGTLGPQLAAVNGWTTSIPGLVALPNGSLLAVFGAISPPKPKQVSDLWSISSTDGGNTWTAPEQAGAGEPQAYGANVRAEQSGAATVISLSVAGGITVQKGLGPSASSSVVTTPSDDFAGDVDSAVDGATHQAVVSWQSLAHKGGDFVQAVPRGAPQQFPGQMKNEVVISSRDNAPGVFGAYTTDGTHVRLLRYGAGSVAVGSAPAVTPKALGTATGIDGRIWVMWGDEGSLAITRSNRAVTRFEPVQQVKLDALSLYRLGGDGRLGPLDLLVDMLPSTASNDSGTFYRRVLPVLSAVSSVVAVKNKKGQTVANNLTVTVTDAGDGVAGATVTVRGHSAKTGQAGRAQFSFAPSVTGPVTLVVSAPTYQELTAQGNL